MLNISGIEEGYVIDHIRAGSCMKIYDALNLDKCEGEVAIIKNAKSGKLGKKDIIKIEGLVPLDCAHKQACKQKWQRGVS